LSWFSLPKGTLGWRRNRNTAEVIDPPRELGQPGLNLWRTILSEYDNVDGGGREMLALACAALDRAEACKLQIDVSTPVNAWRPVAGHLIMTMGMCSSYEVSSATASNITPYGEPIAPTGRCA
jgi:hypothetical protein